MLENEDQFKKIDEFSQEDKQGIEAKSPEEIVSLLAKGETVNFVYNEHYDVYLHFNPEGTTEVDDRGLKYSLERGDKSKSVAVFVNEIREAAKKLAEFLSAIPEGNLKDMGGEQGLARSILNVEKAGSYLEFK